MFGLIPRRRRDAAFPTSHGQLNTIDQVSQCKNALLYRRPPGRGSSPSRSKPIANRLNHELIAPLKVNDLNSSSGEKLNGTHRHFNLITINHLVDGVAPVSRISDLGEGCIQLSFRKSHFQEPASCR